MPIVQCLQCTNSFYAKPSWIKNGYGKYCSRVCKYIGSKNGQTVSCFTCNKLIYKPAGRLEKSKSKKYFCTKSCQTKWRNTEFSGPKHANWIHGKNTYRSIMLKQKDAQYCVLCKSVDLRVLAVHHIDRNRRNNKLENLAWLCHNCHFLVHHDSVERQHFVDEIAKR